MWNFTRIGPKTKKLWLSINPARRLFEQPGLGQPKKDGNYHFSSPHLDEPYVVGKLLISEAQICSFSRIGQKMKKYRSFNFLPENLEKFCSTELYDARLEGSTIYLDRSSTSRTPLDSSGLGELKYAFFSWTGRNTKKLWRSNLLQLTIFKHGLLEGSTILLQYSFITRVPLESLQLCELNYAIS